jgi:hypothetical protein
MRVFVCMRVILTCVFVLESHELRSTNLNTQLAELRPAAQTGLIAHACIRAHTHSRRNMRHGISV